MRNAVIHVVVAGAAAMGIACNNSSNGASGTGRTAQNRATLTGCLQSGGDDGALVLKVASAADTATTGTAGSTPSAAGDWASGRAYRVVPGKNAELTKYVDSRVAINGYIENGTSDTVGTSGSQSSNGAGASGTSGSSARSTDSAATGNQSAGDQDRTSAGSGMQTLVAESVRKVSDRCIEDAAEQGSTNNR